MGVRVVRGCNSVRRFRAWANLISFAGLGGAKDDP